MSFLLIVASMVGESATSAISRCNVLVSIYLDKKREQRLFGLVEAVQILRPTRHRFEFRLLINMGLITQLFPYVLQASDFFFHSFEVCSISLINGFANL